MLFPISHHKIALASRNCMRCCSTRVSRFAWANCSLVRSTFCYFKMASNSKSLRSILLSTLLSAPLLVTSTVTFAQASSADAAAQQALAQVGNQGKVLSVREKSDQQGKTYFEVQVINNGSVRIVKIPRQ